MKSPEPILDLEHLPFILTLPEVASIYRVSSGTVRTKLQKNLFTPLPIKKYPYRWRRADIEKDLGRLDPNLPMRKHGFATKPGPGRPRKRR